MDLVALVSKWFGGVRSRGFRASQLVETFTGLLPDDCVGEVKGKCVCVLRGERDKDS